MGTRHDYALWLTALAADKICLGRSKPSVVRHKRKNSFSDIGYISLVKRHLQVTQMYWDRTLAMCIMDTAIMIALKVLRIFKAKI